MQELQNKLQYSFRDKSLLEKALTHPSAVAETKLMSNQRLEFLGDAVLQLIISEDIYLGLPGLAEGALSKLRSQIVCADSLFTAGANCGLSDYLILGKGEELSGGRTKKNIIADAMESLIGAIFLDGGFEAAKSFVLFALKDIIVMAKSGQLTYDYKTTLQELAQSWETGELLYELIRVEGPEHDQVFFSRAVLGKRKFSIAEGRSRKQSEQNAAEIALRELKISH